MSAVRMTLTELVASADSWPDGVAPERPLLAYLSGLSQPALEHCLQRALLAAIDLVEPITESVEIRSSATGASSVTSQTAWNFPGGDFLEEAIEAASISVRIYRDSIKSLSAALEALQLTVAAVVEREDHKRSPNEWLRMRGAIVSQEPGAVLEVLSVEQRNARTRTRRTTWLAVLSAMQSDT
ncbi:MAG: hypothetical protein GQE15_21120 [Archangiaceae bacterium]|nr:hypothetical protein [Archangiaceae bacterium]